MLNPSTISTQIHYAANQYTDEYLDANFTLEEINQQIIQFKTNKAAGEDRIPYEFFINATEEYKKGLDLQEFLMDLTTMSPFEKV